MTANLDRSHSASVGPAGRRQSISPESPDCVPDAGSSETAQENWAVAADDYNTDEDVIGIVSELGTLCSGAIINEAALARLFRRHPVSIKCAVERGELPPPTRLLGGNAWTAGVIVRHIEKRLEAAAKEFEKTARRIDSLKV